MSFTLVSDVGAVAVLPVSDVRDDLCAPVRQLDTVFSLDRVSVTGLMAVVVITGCVVSYRVSELIRFGLKQEQKVQSYCLAELERFGLKQEQEVQYYLAQLERFGLKQEQEFSLVV
jgi:hypothetical protein